MCGSGFYLFMVDATACFKCDTAALAALFKWANVIGLNVLFHTDASSLNDKQLRDTSVYRQAFVC